MKMLNVAVFTAAVLIGVAFGAALLFSRPSLEGAYQAFRDAPLALQAVEAVLLLPWVLALAAWHAGWALWLKALVVAGLAWASIYVLLPWKG
jgi:hypothetical protein